MFNDTSGAFEVADLGDIGDEDGDDAEFVALHGGPAENDQSE
jgi:hypothetical protein